MSAQHRLSQFSFLCGLTSLILLFFGLSLPFGALGLILALLSRGAGSMDSRGKAGFVLSLIGLVIGLAVSVSSIYLIRSGALAKTYDEMRDMLETTYGGDDTEEMFEQLEELFGVTVTPSAGGDVQ